MVVGVGSEINILPTQHAARFSDFLDWHLRKTLGVEWGKAQLACPLADRHQILQLYDARCRRERELSLAGDGEYVGPLVDAIFAWFSLAYDVYLIRHNSKLQELLVKRLKHKSTFQGARHELAVAAIMIVAGFDIAFEDDGDIGSKHVEFVATDKYGERVAVEAKSRHRPGVLGYQSNDWKKPNYRRLGVESLLRNATEKRTGLPTVVFIDLNVPPQLELDRSA